MDFLATHIVLCSGHSEEACRTKVIRFFESTSLVNYDKIEFDQDSCYTGTEKAFSPLLASALQKNRDILADFITELGEAGFSERGDLTEVAQGYPSKVLHIIAHFLDGFIGIDSAFYNLVDDSHWLSDTTTDAIREAPERFWLFTVDGYSLSPREAVLLHR